MTQTLLLPLDWPDLSGLNELQKQLEKYWVIAVGFRQFTHDDNFIYLSENIPAGPHDTLYWKVKKGSHVIKTAKSSRVEKGG